MFLSYLQSIEPAYFLVAVCFMAINIFSFFNKRKQAKMNNRSLGNFPLVDLVIAIDTSPSMKNEAQALNQIAQTAIRNAKIRCPCNLRITWLGIEGIWKGTKFDRQVRAYLIRECGVSETALRSRKRGTLKSAGAQEDGARAIADIIEYFNWREKAAKAVFYLGDEALDGGGNKTERADFDAANIVIQKAQTAGVAIHTYFGTSKSKHRQGIASEYARLATDTGGQSFTDRDITKGFTGVLTQVICSSLAIQASDSVAKTVATSKAVTVETAIATGSNNSNQQSQSTAEEHMQLLTIDTKDNCYVIDPDGMNDLQLNVASKLTLDKGSYEIKIADGNYSYSQSEKAEPFVLLWIYGTDNSTFVNQNTGVETGATWMSLNGYKQTLQLEVKEKAVLCALFFDINNKDNSGSIQLTIKSNNSGEIQELTVDSKQNCYVLDEKYLLSIKQWGNNFIELEPGNYRVKIREGNASYWSDEKKFKLEPWALIWIKAGSFIPQLTGVEVKETWCSLNGLQDEFILEVKAKTTLSGLFFDTFKEDNEGQIIVEIESISAEVISEKYSQQENSKAQTTTVSNSGQKVVSTASSNSTTKETQTVTSSSSTNVSTNVGRGMVSTGGSSFNFRFDEAQIEQMWQEMAAKIETSVTVQDEQDEKKEAYYWDNLEKWLLKGYQTQAKELAMQVARVEFMMKSITQQMEVSFNQNFQAWSGYFDSRLNELIDTRMTEMVSEQVNLKISDRSTEIKNQVIQQLQSDIDKRVESVVNLKISDRSTEIKNQVVQQLQEDIDRRVESVVNLKVDNQAQNINNQVVQQLQEEMDRRINTVVNVKVENQSQEINNQVVQQLQEEMDKRIDSVVNLKITDQTPNIKNLVIQQLQADVDKRIDSVVNLKLADQTLEISDSVTKQLQGDMDKRIDTAVDLKIENQSQNIKNLVVQQLQSDIDNRINSVVENKTDNSVQVVVNNVINNVDDRIDVKLENKILNFRDDVTSIVKNELNQNYTDSIKTTVLSDIKKQQFFMDMQTIKAEVNNFYSRLGQFETQLYLRIEQGDTQLYNWTLEQLTALQGCLSDRQTLSDMFETFAGKLRDELDNAPCVQPSRFTPMTATVGQDRISPAQPQQLPGS